MYLFAYVKGKGKVVPVLFLTEHHAMNAYLGVEVQLHSFFDLGTRCNYYITYITIVMLYIIL
jgi:hypothetical protein